MADPGPKPSSGLSGLLGQVLGYIDRPWKLFVVIALIIVGGGSWIFYQKLDRIFEVWITPDRAYLKTDDVPRALEKLREEVTADLIQVWEVDIEVGSKRYVAAIRQDKHEPVIPQPRRLPVVESETDIISLAGFLSGNPPCVVLTPGGSSLIRRLAQRGFSYGCAVKIPSQAGVLVGVIYMVWEKAPDMSDQAVALGAAREIADTLVGP